MVAELAESYTSPALGELAVRKDGGDTTFDFSEWKTTVASRKNDDETVSFVTAAPAVSRFNLSVEERFGKRVLVVRDGQHEYPPRLWVGTTHPIFPASRARIPVS